MSPRSFLISAIRQRLVLLSVLVLIMTGCTVPDIQDLQQFVAAKKASSPGKELKPLPKIEPYKPFAYTAQGLKDPFATSVFVQEALVAMDPPPVDNGIHPDPDRPREELEKYALGSLKMVGTFQNILDGEALWALIKAPDGIIHRIKEGNYLGADHGQVMLITEQRIDLQEIVAEGRGWVERGALLSLAE